MRARAISAVAAMLVLALVLSACSTSYDSDTAQRARQLVRSVRAAGVGPYLTVATAESLYGKDAPSVCGPLEDDPVTLATWARIPLGGMPASKTSDLIAYDRAVVRTYCPEQSRRFDELLEKLNYGD